MGFIIKIAYKNLSRHKLRTFVSITAIAFSVMIVVFARGLINGMIDTLSVDHIQYNSGHIKIIDQEYLQQERLLPLNYPVDGFNGEGPRAMTADLKEIKDVEMVISRLKFGAMAGTENELITMCGWGVEPEQELIFTDIEDFLVEGRMAQTGRMEVVMGTALLKKLDRKVGEKITIVYNTAFNSLKGSTFEIVGRLESGLKMLNEVVFYLPLDQAQRLLEMDDQVTELLLVTSDKKIIHRVLPEVKKLLADKGATDRYLALGYKETSDLIPLMDIMKIIYNQIYIFLVLLSCIVVINTMIMIVKERTKEIGMMTAMGLESKEILQLFVIEGAIMGVLGSLLGAVSGSVLTSYLAEVGLDYTSAMSGMSADIIFDAIVYPVSSIGNTIFAFMLGMFIVTIACLIPARRAASLEPTEAMRA
ncbi:MAG TPA: ABC transporter permease [Firmicutes bacterium]|jgi:putative ABC transport system permease protein|nr:ABC transporter permease [Bacillota bacterium]HBT16411.1 ABC transporter permease [Bacillota bacterium]